MIDIEHKESSDFQIVKVTGDVDASSSIHLDAAMGEALNRGKHIVVDLEGLEYISSAGLGVFMSYLKEVQNKELKMILFGLNEKVNHVFQILGLDQLLLIKNNLEEVKQELHVV